MFRVTVNFSEVQNKTKMEMTMSLPSEQAAKEAKVFIKKASGDSTWDRLAEYLSPTDAFFINRTFDAPTDVVFDMWTDPKHFVQWLPPTGLCMECLRAEIQPGGSSFFCMRSGNGITMYGKVNYKTIEKPNLIVYSQVFCDQDEKVSRHPSTPTWPETLLTTVTLTKEDTNRTRVTIKSEVHGEASDAERESFRKGRSDMTQGWTGSFDKLEACLSDNSLQDRPE